MTTLLIVGGILVLVFTVVTVLKKASRRDREDPAVHNRYRSSGANVDSSGIAFLPIILSSDSNNERDAHHGGTHPTGNGDSGSENGGGGADYGGNDTGSGGGDSSGGGGDSGGGGGGSSD